jgi:hypothetical protein
MADEDRVRHWARVVDKSTLEVIITGTTQTTSVTASVDWLDSVNTDEEIVDTVNGDPFTLNMRSPRIYSLDLLLHFVTAHGKEQLRWLADGLVSPVDREPKREDASRDDDQLHE